MIKISVIVPIYNVERYLDQCLASLRNQTLSDLEIIMVNDGSKDGSASIAMRYEQSDPEHFRYFEKKNGGLSDARNYGMQFARGLYITFLDSDDYVLNTTYETLWKAANNGTAEIVECEYTEFYDNSEHRESKKTLPESYTDCFDYMIHSRVNAWNKLYRRDLINRYDLHFPKGLLYEDIVFFFELVPHLEQMPVTIHESLILYRQREGSIMSSTTDRILDIHRDFEILFGRYRQRNLGTAYLNALEYKYVRTVFSSFLFKSLRMKDKYLRASILKQHWSMVQTNCPGWKKNPHLKRHSLRNFYLSLMSPVTITILGFFIR